MPQDNEKQQQQHLITLFLYYLLHLFLFLSPWRCIKRFWNRIGRYYRRPLPSHRRRPRQQASRGALAIATFNIWELSGIYEDDFEDLFQEVREMLMLPRSSCRPRHTTTTVLQPRVRLLLVLHWLRDYSRHKVLSALFHIDRSTVSREILHLVPKLLPVLHRWGRIMFPTNLIPHPFEGVVGAIDCTTHYRYRVHPGQAEYYRGDKHAHFLTAQIVCSLSGVIYQIDIGKGHNNDSGMFRLSDVRSDLVQKSMKLLSDRGYSHYQLVRRDDRKGPDWNRQHAALRSVVETVAGLVHCWGAAAQVFRQSPELQAQAVMICYFLVNFYLQQFPLRMTAP